MALVDYTRTSFTHAGITRDVLTLAPDGPPDRGVIVIHELPGITSAVMGFAERLVDRGALVWLPSLVGTPGQEPTALNLAQSFAKVCVAREFAYWATDTTAPVVDWLRALARDLSSELGGRPVGAVGMCFSGGFALAMATDPAVVAPVLAQPAAPGPIGAERRRSLHLSELDLAQVIENGCAVMGVRFTGDQFVPAARFETLQEAFGDRFIAVEITSPDRALDIKPWAHSVLTEDLIDVPGHPTHAALHEVLDFIDSQLR